MHRPEFISRSRQRVMHLALQAEERRLQAGSIRERNLFNQPDRPSRLPKPAGLQNHHLFNELLLLSLSTQPLLAEVGPCAGDDVCFYLFVCEGTALLKRAVPRKEMIQRSKQ